MKKGLITDFDLQALVDNELTADREGIVRDYIRHNLRARRRYEELLAQKSMLQEWWAMARKPSYNA